MLPFVTIIHVLLCIFMMFVILLQPGKDAGMGSALGGGAATSAFGGRGAVTFLSKLTAVCAGLFFLTSLGLSFVGMKTSVAAGVSLPAKKAGATQPASPGAAGGETAPAPTDAASTDKDEDANAHASEGATSPAPKEAAPAASSDKKTTSPSPGKGAAPAQKSPPATQKR